jgi:hypothetical protein
MQASLDAYLRDRREKLNAHVQALDSNKLSNTDENILAKELVDKFTLQSPTLLEDRKKIDAQEANITVDRTNSIFFDDDDRPYTTKGLNIRVEIPFNGNSELFNFTPSTYTLSGMPEGTVQGGNLVLVYETVEKDPEKIKQLWQHDLGQINQYLGWIAKDLLTYNASLENGIKAQLGQRKTEAGTHQSLINAIKLG